MTLPKMPLAHHRAFARATALNAVCATAAALLAPGTAGAVAVPATDASRYYFGTPTGTSILPPALPSTWFTLSAGLGLVGVLIRRKHHDDRA